MTKVWQDSKARKVLRVTLERKVPRVTKACRAHRALRVTKVIRERKGIRAHRACKELRETRAIKVLLEAVRQRNTTQDLGGSLGTREAGEWVAKRVTAS